MNNDRAYNNMISSLVHPSIDEDGSDVDMWVRITLSDTHIDNVKKINRLTEIVYQLDFYHRYTKYYIKELPSMFEDISITDLEKRTKDKMEKIETAKQLCKTFGNLTDDIVKKIFNISSNKPANIA